MCPMSHDDNDDVVIKGGTDSTQIGNVGDRLKVDAQFSTVPTVGIQEFPTFLAVAYAVSVGYNKSMFSLANAGGSGYAIRIREIRVVNMQTAAVTGVVASFNMYRATSHSGGSSITPVTFDTNDSLSGSITAKSGATITGESGGTMRHWEWSTDEWNPGAPDVESADHTLQLLVPLYTTMPHCRPITIRPGQAMTIKQENNTSVGSFDISVLFTQEPV